MHSRMLWVLLTLCSHIEAIQPHAYVHGMYEIAGYMKAVRHY